MGVRPTQTGSGHPLPHRLIAEFQGTPLRIMPTVSCASSQQTSRDPSCVTFTTTTLRTRRVAE